MKNSFIDILREPDSVLFQFEDSDIRFEEPANREEQNARISYEVKNGEGVITLYPSERPVRRVKLRWRGDMSDVISVLGDAFERMYDVSFGADMTPAWRSIIPELRMPWYFFAYDGEVLNSYGVKCGCDAFCHFQLDEYGITLWLDVRNGGGGVSLNEPLVCARVTERRGVVGENPYLAAREFCKMLCESPKLPDEPIFGVNNWYWAYGKISHDIVMSETDNLMDMCADAVCRSYMIIDDGWQICRYSTEKHGSYNGGPWNMSNVGFESMEKTARAIHEKGAKAGIWFRPLLTTVQVHPEMESPLQKNHSGILLDPSHPEVLSMVRDAVRGIRGWGYELIKHDFSVYDSVGLFGSLADDTRHFYDKTKTNATILKNLYWDIQDATNGGTVIGCNTVSHITAGIHQSARIGHDTSGRSFEITRIAGTSSFLRLPQNNTFYAADPDCAAFTDRVPTDVNLDFLEACAVTGFVTLASVTPGSIKGDDMRRIREIYKIASRGGNGALPEDWLMHNCMSKFKTPQGESYNYNWYRVYDGVRSHYTWNN